jgi:hypothetical protein
MFVIEKFLNSLVKDMENIHFQQIDGGGTCGIHNAYVDC